MVAAVFPIDYSVDFEGVAFFSEVFIINKPELSLSEVEYNWASNWMHTETSHDDIYRDDQFRPDESFEKLYLLVRAWTMKGTDDDMKVEHVYDWEVRELPLQNY